MAQIRGKYTHQGSCQCLQGGTLPVSGVKFPPLLIPLDELLLA